MAKASKLLLMLLPAIMLTAYGVGVLRSDDCYEFLSMRACECSHQLTCSCYEGTCGGPIRICLDNYALLPVIHGGYAAGTAQLLPCWREFACRTLDNKPCGNSKPCMAAEELDTAAPKFSRPTMGDPCNGGGGGDPK